MNINGIWSIELGGAYGWEPIGTLYLRDGRIMGGGRNHYSTGKYKTKENGIVLHIEINQYGEKRALFGKKSERVCVYVKANWDGNNMVGEATLPPAQIERFHYGLCIRLMRRADLPDERSTNTDREIDTYNNSLLEDIA